jgi:hypothetical protein
MTIAFVAVRARYLNWRATDLASIPGRAFWTPCRDDQMHRRRGKELIRQCLTREEQ